MSEQPTSPRSAADLFAATKAHMQTPVSPPVPPTPPTEKPRSLTELFDVDYLPLAGPIVPFRESSPIVVPGLRQPKPRRVAGPTPKPAPSRRRPILTLEETDAQRMPEPVAANHPNTRVVSPFSLANPRVTTHEADAPRTAEPDKTTAETRVISPFSVETLRAAAKPTAPAAPATSTVPETDTPVAPATSTAPETDAPVAPATSTAPETDAPVAPATSTAPETDAPVAPETSTAPETDAPAAPATSTAPETDAPAAPATSTAPETDAPVAPATSTAPETDAPVAPATPTAPEHAKTRVSSPFAPPPVTEPPAQTAHRPRTTVFCPADDTADAPRTIPIAHAPVVAPTLAPQTPLFAEPVAPADTADAKGDVADDVTDTPQGTRYCPDAQTPETTHATEARSPFSFALQMETVEIPATPPQTPAPVGLSSVSSPFAIPRADAVAAPAALESIPPFEDILPADDVLSPADDTEADAETEYVQPVADERADECAPEREPEPLHTATARPAFSYPEPKHAYNRKTALPAYRTHLRRATTFAALRLVLLLIVLAASLALALAPRLSLPLPAFLSPAVYPLIYRMAELELLLLGVLLVLPQFWDGLADALHGRATGAAFFAAPTLLFVLAEVTAILLDTTANGAPDTTFAPFSAAFVFGALALCLGELTTLSRARLLAAHVWADNFRVAVEATPDGKATLKEITYPTNIAAHTAQIAPPSRAASALFFVLLVLCAGFGGAAFVYYQSLAKALSFVALSLAALFPLGHAFVRAAHGKHATRHSLYTYGGAVLSEADKAHLAAADTLCLSEHALFVDSDTSFRFDRIASDEAHTYHYLLQAVADALGGSFQIAGEALLSRMEPLPHTAVLTKHPLPDEDGLEVSVDGTHVVHVGLYTYMLRTGASGLQYTEADYNTERSGNAQYLFLAERGVVFAKLALSHSLSHELCDALHGLSARGIQAIVETDSPFFHEDLLLAKLGDTRALLHVTRSDSVLSAPTADIAEGGLIASSPSAAISLLCAVSAYRPARIARALATIASTLIGAALLPCAVFFPTLLPFLPLALVGTQLLRLPLSYPFFREK